MNVVTPEYFRVMGISLLSGRWFTDADSSGNPAVAVITESSARKFFPGQNPIGKHVCFSEQASG